MSMNFTQVWAQLKAEWAGRSDKERRLVSSGFEDAFSIDEVDDFGVPIHGMLDEETGEWVSAEELERIRDDYVFGAEAWNDLCIARLNPCDAIHAIDAGMV
jgi:hypothetical protein